MSVAVAPTSIFHHLEPKALVLNPAPQDEWKKGIFGGMTYNYLHIRPAVPEKATFLLLHGFPNGASNYQYFVPELTKLGYGIVLPELLGYGETDKPRQLEAYAFHPMADQLAELLSAEGVERAVVVGHDFGGPMAARFSQFHPEKTLALVLGGSPYAPPAPQPLNVDAALKAIKPVLGYENIGYFKFLSTEFAPAVLDEHIESFISVMYGPPEEWKDRLCKVGGLETNLREDHKGPEVPWFKQEDHQELVTFLKSNGLVGPCSWFRAAVSSVDVADYDAIDQRVHSPYLYISPQRDPIYPLPLAKQQDTFCDDITTKEINTGHWIYEEDPKGSAEIILEWGKEKKLF